MSNNQPDNQSGVHIFDSLDHAIEAMSEDMRTFYIALVGICENNDEGALMELDIEGIAAKSGEDPEKYNSMVQALSMTIVSIEIEGDVYAIPLLTVPYWVTGPDGLVKKVCIASAKAEPRSA